MFLPLSNSFLCFLDFIQNLFQFHIHFLNLLLDSSKRHEMFLPICRTDIRILDGIAAVDHHVVSHIDSHMAGSRRIVSTLKENQISRFCFGRRYICTAGTKPVCCLPSYIPAISAVIDYPTDKSGTVKTGTGRSTAPHIRISQIFFRFMDHVCKFFIRQCFCRNFIAKTTGTSATGQRIYIKQIITVPICQIVIIIPLFFLVIHSVSEHSIQIMVCQHCFQPVYLSGTGHFHFLTSIVICYVCFPCLMSVCRSGCMVSVINIELHPVLVKSACIFYNILHTIHHNLRAQRYKRIGSVYRNRVVFEVIRWQ